MRTTVNIALTLDAIPGIIGLSHRHAYDYIDHRLRTRQEAEVTSGDLEIFRYLAERNGAIVTIVEDRLGNYTLTVTTPENTCTARSLPAAGTT